MKRNFDISEAKKLSILAYLQRQGFSPVHKQTGEFLFLSPFRDEKKPSFRVREKSGRDGEDLWFDFGLGGDSGGDIISLAQKLHNIQTIDEVLKHLLIFNIDSFGEQKTALQLDNEKPDFKKPSITILGEPKQLNHFVLLKYLRLERKIPDNISQQYLSLIYYKHLNTHNDKHYFGFAWKNNSGAYEIRGSGYNSFKSVTGQKDISIFPFNTESGNIYIFEAMLDYLSALVLKNQIKLDGIVIILNGASMIQRVESYLKDKFIMNIHVFTDNDEAGNQALSTLQAGFKKQNIIKHDFYDAYKDVNEYLVALKT